MKMRLAGALHDKFYRCPNCLHVQDIPDTYVETEERRFVGTTFRFTTILSRHTGVARTSPILKVLNPDGSAAQAPIVFQTMAQMSSAIAAHPGFTRKHQRNMLDVLKSLPRGDGFSFELTATIDREAASMEQSRKRLVIMLVTFVAGNITFSFRNFGYGGLILSLLICAIVWFFIRPKKA